VLVQILVELLERGPLAILFQPQAQPA